MPTIATLTATPTTDDWETFDCGGCTEVNVTIANAAVNLRTAPQVQGVDLGFGPEEYHVPKLLTIGERLGAIQYKSAVVGVPGVVSFVATN